MVWQTIIGKAVVFLFGVLLIQLAFSAPTGLRSATETPDGSAVVVENEQSPVSSASADTSAPSPPEDDVLPHENDVEAINTAPDKQMPTFLPDEAVDNSPVLDPADEEQTPPDYILPPPPAPPVPLPDDELVPCRPTWDTLATDCEPDPLPCGGWGGPPYLLSDRACLVE